MANTQRQKTFTARFDPETHSLLTELAREYGQNKTQVLKRMIREETARKGLPKSRPLDPKPKCIQCLQSLECVGGYSLVCLTPECVMNGIEV